MAAGCSDEFVFEKNDLSFQIPSNIMLWGSSSSGKTTLLLKIVKNAREMFYPKPAQIVYSYGEFNDAVPKMRAMGVTVYAAVPTPEFLKTCAKPLLLILDDQMLAVSKNFLDELFTKISHHQNICVIFVTQNMFAKNLLVARQNSHYIIMMRAPNSAMHIKTLAIQLFADKYREFMNAYNDATKEPYGYLVIDLHPRSNPMLKLRSKILPNENTTIYYQ
jgi:GTPase SAR1 family protein